MLTTSGFTSTKTVFKDNEYDKDKHLTYIVCLLAWGLTALSAQTGYIAPQQ